MLQRRTGRFVGGPLGFGLTDSKSVQQIEGMGALHVACIGIMRRANLLKIIFDLCRR
jgi:hypothetical protein